MPVSKGSSKMAPLQHLQPHKWMVSRSGAFMKVKEGEDRTMGASLVSLLTSGKSELGSHCKGILKISISRSKSVGRFVTAPRKCSSSSACSSAGHLPLFCARLRMKKLLRYATNATIIRARMYLDPKIHCGMKICMATLKA